MPQSTSGESAERRAFTHEQAFEAPRDVVFRAWTDAATLARWWGPKGMTINLLDTLGRADGRIRYSMGSGDFMMFGRFTFEEVAPSERLVIIDARVDASGDVLTDDGFPAELRYEVMFAEAGGGGRTTVSLRVTPRDADGPAQAAFEAHMDSLGGGFRGAFEKLDAYLRGR